MATPLLLVQIAGAGREALPSACPRSPTACSTTPTRGPIDPFALFEEWFAAGPAGEVNDPHAMPPSPRSIRPAMPDVRIVLLNARDAARLRLLHQFRERQGHASCAEAPGSRLAPGFAVVVAALRGQRHGRGSASPVVRRAPLGPRPRVGAGRRGEKAKPRPCGRDLWCSPEGHGDFMERPAAAGPCSDVTIALREMPVGPLWDRRRQIPPAAFN
jgi:hypothetical protein